MTGPAFSSRTASSSAPDGSSYAGSFVGTGSSSNALYAEAADGNIGLNVNNGSVILSHESTSPGTLEIGGANNAVVALNEGDYSAISLTAGTPGQILYVYNGDPENYADIVDGLHTNYRGPNWIDPGTMRMFIYVSNADGDGWVSTSDNVYGGEQSQGPSRTHGDPARPNKE